MKVDLTLRGDLHAPRAARMALDDLVHDLDGRLLTDLRLVITEMVGTIIRSGSGQPLSVRIEILSAQHLRGEVTEEGDPMEGFAALSEEAAPILEQLTSHWGLGPQPRRMWFEIEARSDQP